MASRLASGWRADMSLEALIELRDELDAMLTRIRSERSIRTPVFTCLGSTCPVRRVRFDVSGSTCPSAEPHVSVRALIFALARLGIATAEVSKAFEKD
jgi:hypothetical protein